MTQGFQPGGRSPAPAPLDLVQDFVNTEIPDWDRDDIATPEVLAAWLAGHGLLPRGATVESRAVWRSISASSSAPSRTTIVEIQIQVMKPMTAPKDP